MEKRIKSSPQKLINGEKCHHYWLLGTPDGPTCKGICRFCGEEKEFASSIEGVIAMKTNTQSVKTDISEDNIEVEDDGLFIGD